MTTDLTYYAKLGVAVFVMVALLINRWWVRQPRNRLRRGDPKNRTQS